MTYIFTWKNNSKRAAAKMLGVNVSTVNRDLVASATKGKVAHEENQAVSEAVVANATKPSPLLAAIEKTGETRPGYAGHAFGAVVTEPSWQPCASFRRQKFDGGGKAGICRISLVRSTRTSPFSDFRVSEIKYLL